MLCKIFALEQKKLKDVQARMWGANGRGAERIRILIVGQKVFFSLIFFLTLGGWACVGPAEILRVF